MPQSWAPSFNTSLTLSLCGEVQSSVQSFLHSQLPCGTCWLQGLSLKLVFTTATGKCIQYSSMSHSDCVIIFRRLFHHPLLYKSVHKMHHEWISPVAMCSIYCHPLEYFVCNLGPVALGPIIAGKSNLVLSNKDMKWDGFAFSNISPFLDGTHVTWFNTVYFMASRYSYINSQTLRLQHNRLAQGVNSLRKMSCFNLNPHTVI